jgi:hypothetical protein
VEDPPLRIADSDRSAARVRALLGPIAVHGAMLVAGMGLLRAFGVVRGGSAARWLAAAGLAYLCGVAGVMLASIVVLVLGGPFDLETFAVVCALLALPLVLELPARRGFLTLPRPSAVRGRPLEQRLAVATLGAFGVLAIVGISSVGNWPVDQYDAWNLWTRKAQLLFVRPHLPLEFFKSAAYYGGGNAPGDLHPDYPLVLPMLEAIHLRGLGRLDVRQVHEVLWLLLVAFVWAGGFLASRISRAAVWSVVLCGAALFASGPLLSAHADVPMALFLGTGVLALGLWLEFGARSDLAVAALLLGGAAGIKNEGLLGAVAALVVGLVVVLSRRQRERVRELVVAAFAFAAIGVIPWRLWLSAHGLKGHLPVGKGLDPGFLVDRFDRVWPSMGALHDRLVNHESVAIFAAIGLALAIVRLRGPSRSPVAAFYLTTGVLYYFALVWAYWISPLPLRFQLDTSVSRVYLGLGFIAVAAILQMGNAVRTSAAEP